MWHKLMQLLRLRMSDAEVERRLALPTLWLLWDHRYWQARQVRRAFDEAKARG
jgi:hypothetical protein